MAGGVSAAVEDEPRDRDGEHAVAQGLQPRRSQLASLQDRSGLRDGGLAEVIARLQRRRPRVPWREFRLRAGAAEMPVRVRAGLYDEPVSWPEVFSERYAEWSAHMTSDIPFYTGLAEAAHGPLVELAVGNGRVAIPVALASGRPVIGIDSSPSMLEQARSRAAEAGVQLDLRAGDMRDLSVDPPAALIYCPFRALLHLPTWADRRRTFERVAASLRPGGRFAWNALAFDHRTAVSLDGQHNQEPVGHMVRYSVGQSRIDIILDGGATSSLWWATKNEWLGLLDVAGLELEALYGGFVGEPFGYDSREMVFVARR